MSEPKRETPRSLIMAGALLALLAADRTVQLVRQLQEKSNGHAEVRPRDAVEFWTLQKGLETTLQGMDRSLEARLDVVDRKLDQLLERVR